MPIGRQTVEFLEYILPDSLALICRASLEKTILDKMSRSSLTLGTSKGIKHHQTPGRFIRQAFELMGYI